MNAILKLSGQKHIRIEVAGIKAVENIYVEAMQQFLQTKFKPRSLKIILHLIEMKIG